MADDTPPRQMSLIPYPYSNGEVVLRRGNAVVTYDAQSRQLSVRDSSDQAVELAECPYCHRPLRDEHPRRDGSEEGHGRPGSNNGFHDRPFVDPEYFEMLAESRRPSPAGSAPPTTPRFVPPALRSGRSREVSGSHDPPTGAEFMGSVPSSAAGQGISKSAFSPGYFEQFFREIRELGRGGNGVVMLVEHVLDRVSLGQFACKRVPVGDDHDWLEKVLVEVRLLQNVVHTNLVRYHWVWLEDYQQGKFTPSIPCLWMLQDYCNGGDLHSYVLGPKKDDEETKEMMKDRVRRNSKVDAHSPPPQEMRGPSKLTFGEIFQFFQDIASGLHHLHKKGYVHRDLKPSNCLLHHDGNSTRVLISDFGEVQEAVAKRASTGATGTISYCAPEILKKDGKGAFGQFTPKSDIFSLGMIVYFMCFGRLPYSNADDINEENEDLDELRAEIMKWPGFDEETRARPDLPEKLYKYLKRLLSVDPNDRPSTEEILSMSKGSSGIAEMASSLVEENSSRVSAIDTPKKGGSPRPPQNRKPQQFRPGLSNLGRQVSADTVRPTSPKRRSSGSGSNHHLHSRGHSRPTSPTDASLIKRPRHVDLPPPSPNDERRQSPRLMLPPPPPGPPTFGQKAMRLIYHHNVRTAVRVTIFLGKVLSLTLPCSPFAASPWLLYPLLALAALDLGFLNLHLREKLLLLMAHFGVFTFAARRGSLCQSGSLVWDDY